MPSSNTVRTMVFATFMMAIAINAFCVRTPSLNIFHGLSQNKMFLIIRSGVFVFQYIVVTFGGKVLGCSPLNMAEWGYCATLAALVLPANLLCGILCRKNGKA